MQKKLDSQNKDDIYIVNELSIDPCVNPYVELKNAFDTSYLNCIGIYQMQYGIYLWEMPIGYLDISKIYETRMDRYVNLTYAILKEHRKKGFAKRVVSAITREILLDRVEYVKSVYLQIASDNLPSIATAKAVGFIEKTEQYDWECDYRSYVKTKLMLEKEKDTV